MATLPVDLMSLASHKTYGPKGMGALYVRRKPRIRIEAQMHGGGHERGMRSGTLPTHQIVGMGEAFRIIKLEMDEVNEKARVLQKRLLDGLKDIEQTFINGSMEHRVPQNLNISFNFVEANRSSWVSRVWRFRPARLALPQVWNPATYCALWAAATSWHTAAFA